MGECKHLVLSFRQFGTISYSASMTRADVAAAVVDVVVCVSAEEPEHAGLWKRKKKEKDKKQESPQRRGK